ncbi:uncharacterized protein LOC143253704 isoform X2 [Tachypleus tridentatus]|uniref:uncharacterized protein LOC143253704 isoform X2 n=1 Tax=Tachypleus tridentatus TaxID=6853 RepID=UPI003FD15CA2
MYIPNGLRLQEHQGFVSTMPKHQHQTQCPQHLLKTSNTGTWLTLTQVDQLTNPRGGHPKVERDLKTIPELMIFTGFTSNAGSSCSVRRDKRLPDIDTVPKVFLQSEFSLHSPETFKTVLPWACIQSDHITVEDFNTCSSSKLLQEKEQDTKN